MTRVRRSIDRRVIGLGLLLVAAACFSERGDVGPDLSTCDVRLPAELLGTTVVAIRNFTFEPADVRVAAGEKVTWVNCAPATEPGHTSTSDTGIWSSPLMTTGGFYTQTFSQAGRFTYHCTPHPFMQGTVVVQ